MLSEFVERLGTSLTDVVDKAVSFLRRRQLADGSIVDSPDVLIFQEWDSVNALNAIAQWRDADAADISGTVEGALAFLRSREKPSGMLSWGAIDVAPTEYCTETSSEYITVLTRLGRLDDARRKAAFLRSRQLPSGEWEEVHSHIPKAFQAEPSVTGFALMSLLELDIEPLYLDEAINFLLSRQKAGGDFGINWYYYSTHYYLMRPAVAALANYGCYAAAGKARDFVLGQQRADGSWFSEVDGFGDYASPEQHTALALGTLANAGLATDEPAVRRGLAWLLSRRRADGAWNGGKYPYPETASYRDFGATQHVFTTSQVLSALKQFATMEMSHDK